jgi:hypothetical protein
VRDAIQELWRQRIHNHFPLYLCLRQLAFRVKRTTALEPNWREFFEPFFLTPGGPSKKPYLRPFTDRNSVVDGMWLNGNLAGSFAPSSFREGMPITKVVEAVGGERVSRYNLRENHWQLARTHLVKGGAQVPAVPLAIFLYRDYGFSKATVPTPGDLINVFKQEFGYVGESIGEFDHLYDDDSSSRDPKIFEPVAP